MTGEQLPISDLHLIRQQHLNLERNHPYSAKSKAQGKQGGTTCDINIGDLVYIKGEKDKTRCRDKYIVISLHHRLCQVCKFISSQFRSKTYDIKMAECFPVVPTALSRFHHGPIRGLQPAPQSDSDSESLSSAEQCSSGEEHVPMPARTVPIDPEPPAYHSQINDIEC